MNAQQATSWLGQAKNKDFLSHPSLSDLQAKAQAYVANLARAEGFGAARGKLATALRTEAQNLPEALTKQAQKLLLKQRNKRQKSNSKLNKMKKRH
jgi:hypothetical protein